MDTRKSSPKMTLRNDQWLFIVQFWTTLTNVHLSWAGVEQGCRPERDRSLLEPVSQKRRMTYPTAAWLQRKWAAILPWEKPPSLSVTILAPFWGGKSKRASTKKITVCTDTDSEGPSVFVGSRQALPLL